MIGFLVIFVAAVIASRSSSRAPTSKAELFAKYPVVDEVLGGLAGRLPGRPAPAVRHDHPRPVLPHTGLPKDVDELPFLRDFWEALNALGDRAASSTRT